MEPETVSRSAGVIQWEDSDTEEAQDSKAKLRPKKRCNATQILQIPGNEVDLKILFFRAAPVANSQPPGT